MTDRTKKRSNAAIDLTVGKPLRRILIFMLPMIIGNVFQQLYSMVDTVVVGRTLGSAALAGVGSTGALSFMIMGFVNGLTHGFSVVTSRYRGARDEEGVRRSFAIGILLTVIVVGIMTIVAAFAAKPILKLMGTKPEFFKYAEEYITTIFAGMLLSAFYNEFSATLRALGDSRVPLYFLIFASILNGGLDCLFILGLHMGVRGAAIATLISQGISAVLTFIYMWIRYPEMRVKLRHFKPDTKSCYNALKLGIPMALQFSVISIGMVFCQSALNTMDGLAVTAYVAASKIDNLAIAVLSSVGNASATYVGQNYGAKRYDRIKLGIKQLVIFSLIMSVVLGAFVISMYKPFTMLFIDKSERSEQLFDYALKYLIFNSGFYVLLTTLWISRSALQGMNRGVIPLFAAALEVAMRAGVAVIAINMHNYTVVCMCNAFAWLGANLILVPSFLLTLKRYIPLIKRNIRHIRMPNPSVPPMMAEKRK
ncbi:MAG: MATE family efflux transporter [Clostridiales bacterium]|nr:MATE family efflux transporter [Clostridiales bacterium]